MEQYIQALESNPNPMAYFIVSLNADGSLIVKTEAESAGVLKLLLHQLQHLDNFTPFFTASIDLETGDVVGHNESESTVITDDIARHVFRLFDITQVLSRRL